MIKSIATMFIASASFAGVALANDTVDKTAQNMKTMFYDAIDKDTSSISFENGSSTLSQSEKNNLAALVKAVKSDSRVQKVVVAAWADKDYPATQKDNLPKLDRELADKRIAAITSALRDLGLTSVESHTMAEHPSWLSKTFNTKDSKVKGEGKIKDQEDQMVAEIGKTLRSKGGPSKAVVVVRRAVDFPEN